MSPARSGFPLLPFLLLSAFLTTSAQEHGRGPTDPKAQNTYAEARTSGKHWSSLQELIDKYRKADKQDSNHCQDCALQAAKLALKTGDPKLARNESLELETLATTPDEQTEAHYLHGVAVLQIGMENHKERDLSEAESEFQKAIALSNGKKAEAIFLEGQALAYLHQDDAAKARFHEFLSKYPPGNLDYVRAARFEKRPELARERMAPGFALKILNGDNISLDELQGKVVLIDFWATWCGPCREALPRIQGIAKKFQGQPLVILSISLDKDATKWQEFVAKNHMTWEQYRDGSDGVMAQRFGVRAIPATFTIDSDGVLQDQHVGDAAIEGKLKKLVAAAEKRAEAPAPAEAN